MGSSSASFSGNSSAVQRGRRRDGRILILSGERRRSWDEVSKQEFLNVRKGAIEGITLLRGRRRNDGLEMLRRCIAVVTGRGSDQGYLDLALTNSFFRPETVR